MKGEWILKEVHFEDGWPSVMRDPITPQQPWLGIDCPRCGHCCPQPNQEPDFWALFDETQRLRAELKFNTTPQQRQWVGLTMEDMAELRRNGLHAISDKHFQAIEAKLRQKNT